MKVGRAATLAPPSVFTHGNILLSSLSPQLTKTKDRMNDHLVPPPQTPHLGALPHHLSDMDPGHHAETTEVLLSLLSQNKALSGNS